MITRVLAVGLLAGLVAGLSVAVLQKFTTTPIILAAEVYEEADEAKAQRASLKFDPYGVAAEARLILVHDHSENGAGEGPQEEWEPHDGLERTLYASTATIATAIGFALMILAGMLVAGDRIDERRAMAWAAGRLRGERPCPGHGAVAGSAGHCRGRSREPAGMVVADGRFDLGRVVAHHPH